MKLTQCDVILKAMLTEKNRTWWSAKDFQTDPYFVGYEATARMSDLINKYDDLIKVSKDGRFRILAINWESKELEDELKRLEINK